MSEMYLAKISGNFVYKRKYGARIDKFEKYFCGCLCLSLFFTFLVVPFIMFSNLGFLTDENPV